LTVHSNFIGGKWVEADASIANINPSDLSDEIGRYAQASVEEVGRVIEARPSGAGPPSSSATRR
jgi:aldehyde dehydrogenase (NAD+)